MQLLNLSSMMQVKLSQPRDKLMNEEMQNKLQLFVMKLNVEDQCNFDGPRFSSCNNVEIYLIRVGLGLKVCAFVVSFSESIYHL